MSDEEVLETEDKGEKQAEVVETPKKDAKGPAETKPSTDASTKSMDELLSEMFGVGKGSSLKGNRAKLSEAMAAEHELPYGVTDKMADIIASPPRKKREKSIRIGKNQCLV